MRTVSWENWRVDEKRKGVAETRTELEGSLISGHPNFLRLSKEWLQKLDSPFQHAKVKPRDS